MEESKRSANIKKSMDVVQKFYMLSEFTASSVEDCLPIEGGKLIYSVSMEFDESGLGEIVCAAAAAVPKDTMMSPQREENEHEDCIAYSSPVEESKTQSSVFDELFPPLPSSSTQTTLASTDDFPPLSAHTTDENSREQSNEADNVNAPSSVGRSHELEREEREREKRHILALSSATTAWQSSLSVTHTVRSVTESALLAAEREVERNDFNLQPDALLLPPLLEYRAGSSLNAFQVMQWQVQYEEYLSEVRGMGGTPIPPISCVQLHITMKLFKASPSLTGAILHNSTVEQICGLLLLLEDLAPTPPLVPELWSWDPFNEEESHLYAKIRQHRMQQAQDDLPPYLHPDPHPHLTMGGPSLGQGLDQGCEREGLEEDNHEHRRARPRGVPVPIGLSLPYLPLPLPLGVGVGGGFTKEFEEFDEFEADTRRQLGMFHPADSAEGSLLGGEGGDFTSLSYTGQDCVSIDSSDDDSESWQCDSYTASSECEEGLTEAEWYAGGGQPSDEEVYRFLESITRTREPDADGCSHLHLHGSQGPETLHALLASAVESSSTLLGQPMPSRHVSESMGRLILQRLLTYSRQFEIRNRQGLGLWVEPGSDGALKCGERYAFDLACAGVGVRLRAGAGAGSGADAEDSSMCITDRGDSPSTVAGPSSGVPSRLSSPLVQPLAGADESDDADMAGESTLFRPIYTGNFVSNANANAKANVKSGLPTQETYQNQNHIQQNQMQNSFNALEECALQQEIVWALEIVPGSKFLKTLLRKHRSHYIRTDSARAQLWHFLKDIFMTPKEMQDPDTFQRLPSDLEWQDFGKAKMPNRAERKQLKFRNWRSKHNLPKYNNNNAPNYASIHSIGGSEYPATQHSLLSNLQQQFNAHPAGLGLNPFMHAPPQGFQGPRPHAGVPYMPLFAAPAHGHGHSHGHTGYGGLPYMGPPPPPPMREGQGQGQGQGLFRYM